MRFNISTQHMKYGKRGLDKTLTPGYRRIGLLRKGWPNGGYHNRVQSGRFWVKKGLRGLGWLQRYESSLSSVSVTFGLRPSTFEITVHFGSSGPSTLDLAQIGQSRQREPTSNFISSYRYHQKHLKPIWSQFNLRKTKLVVLIGWGMLISYWLFNENP